ncbi:MAG TPA: hypothetical protein VJ283_02295, partial [Trebonia sp.]|nr:hypothetical protein [Trebonia sp.]
SQVTSVTPVGFVDVATTFQGAETIKCGHGVYKVGWRLQSRRHAAGPRTTASDGEVEALLLPAVMRYNAPVTRPG